MVVFLPSRSETNSDPEACPFSRSALQIVANNDGRHYSVDSKYEKLLSHSISSDANIDDANASHNGRHKAPCSDASGKNNFTDTT